MALTNLNNHFELILKSILATDENRIAYIDIHQKKYSYKDLKITILKYQTALKTAQLKENDNVICLTPRGIELVACLLACFSANKTVVFIDPRLGLQNFYKRKHLIDSPCLTVYSCSNSMIFLGNSLILKTGLEVAKGQSFGANSVFQFPHPVAFNMKNSNSV